MANPLNEATPSPTAARSVRGWIPWVIIVICLCVAVMPLIPASSDRAQVPGSFSADRALAHVGLIAREPHPMGSEEISRVRDYLTEALIGIGLSPVMQSVRAADYFGEPGRTVEVVNVMARIEGASTSGALALVAHYDTVPNTPGANDDSAAVAFLIEVARALVSGPPVRNNVILLFTNGEEPSPRFGSTAFVEEHPWFEDIAFVLNLEATGSGGPPLLLEISGSGRTMADLLAESAPHPAAFSFITHTSELIGGIEPTSPPSRRPGSRG